MAKNKIGLQFDGLEDIISNLENAGASAKDAVDSALKASKDFVTDALVKDTTKANYPAKGKYSTGELAKSIDKNFTVKWQGLTSEINIGYNFKKAGLTSIFLMYGTPRHKKVQKIYNDIYGSATKKKLAKIQEEALNKIVERVSNSGG